MGHNSLHGWEKCTQDGVYYGRTTWKYVKDTTCRTDALFNQIVYEDHQKSQSVLSNLDLGLVTQVPLDYMHLICLGIVKKLVCLWVEKGPKKCRLSAHSIQLIFYRLSAINDHYPKEFSRRLQPFHKFKYWKATQYRSFILYVGPVVLKNMHL